MATVYAVVSAQIEISVRPSGGGEKLEDLMRVAQSEAETILRNKLQGNNEIAIKSVNFSHAVVREK